MAELNTQRSNSQICFQANIIGDELLLNFGAKLQR